MPAPENHLKSALAHGETLYGCWAGLAAPYPTEVLAEAGFDWLVIDAEHAPNDLGTISAQLGVLRGSSTQAVVRLPMGETWAIKQVLDAGAQTLIIPMVESAAQATGLVRAMRYPPEGVRGSGAAPARASRFSGIADYIPTANAQMCLMVQVESRAGLDALDDILAVDGVDGVFIGPADRGGRADAGHPRARPRDGGALPRLGRALPRRGDRRDPASRGGAVTGRALARWLSGCWPTWVPATRGWRWPRRTACAPIRRGGWPMPILP